MNLFIYFSDQMIMPRIQICSSQCEVNATYPFWTHSTQIPPQKMAPPISHLLSRFIKLPLQILQHSHHLLATLRMMLPYPSLELLRQDGQELFQHQQFQDLLLCVCLCLVHRRQSSLSCQSLLGPGVSLIAELPETLTREFPAIRQILL